MWKCSSGFSPGRTSEYFSQPGLAPHKRIDTRDKLPHGGTVRGAGGAVAKVGISPSTGPTTPAGVRRSPVKMMMHSLRSRLHRRQIGLRYEERDLGNPNQGTKAIAGPGPQAHWEGIPGPARQGGSHACSFLPAHASPGRPGPCHSGSPCPAITYLSQRRVTALLAAGLLSTGPMSAPDGSSTGPHTAPWHYPSPRARKHCARRTGCAQ